MRLLVAPEVFAKYPSLRIGAVFASQLDNSAREPAVEALLRQAEREVQGRLNLATYRDHPHIRALHEVHRGFGSNANRHPPVGAGAGEAGAERKFPAADQPSRRPL